MCNFGELLRRLRGSRSLRAVAAELRMPLTTLWALENRKSVPRGPVLQRVVDYYGVPVSYFYPAPNNSMKSSQPARQWLLAVRKGADVKETVARYDSPEIPEDVKTKVAEAIRKKKHAEDLHEH